MGFFSFIQEIAMDLGTANTIIISDDKIVVDEPSVVALDRRTDKMIAVGEKAKLMHEKTHENIRTIRPLRDGVIADFTACEQMMRGLIKMVHTGSKLFSPSLRMVIGVPSGSTEVELRAVRDSAEHADGRDVYLIFEPMAAAIGIGIDVEAPEGNMIVDIGGGSTEIAVISLGGIVSNNSIRVAGDELTSDIQEYMSRQHNVKVSERMAERIKIHVGSALTDLGDEGPEDYIVHNGDIVVGMDGIFHINSWSGDDAYLVQRACSFRPKEECMKGFIFQAIQEPIKFFEKTLVGATVAHLGKKHIDSIELCIPKNFELYKPFSKFYNQRQGLLSQIRLLTEARDRLLPKLMSGEIKVS